MEPTLSETRRLGARPFVVGCAVWLACGAACEGQSVALDDEAGGGHAGESSGGSVSTTKAS